MASVVAAVYVSVASVKMPVVFAPMDKATPGFPPLALRFTVLEDVIELDATRAVN
jgi:hypothetical protein